MPTFLLLNLGCGRLPALTRAVAAEPVASDPVPLEDLSVWKGVGAQQGAALGVSLAIGDLDGDGTADLVAGGRAGTLDGGPRSGTVVVFSGPFDALTSDAKAADAVLYGAPHDDAALICSVGDLDSDGSDDLVVGAPWAGELSGSNASAGSAYIVRGPLSGTIDLSREVQAFHGSSAGEVLGNCAGPGDVDGDGTSDIVISSSEYEGANDRRGAVYLLRGPAEQSSIKDADQILEGEVDDEYVGFGVAALGDLNADGMQDYGVSNAVNNTASSSRDGVAAYLVTDYVSGVSHPRDAGATVFYDLDWAPHALVFVRVGDIDGDGYEDVGFATGGFARSPTISVIAGPFGGETVLGMSDATGTVLYSSASGANPWLAAATPLGDWDGSGNGGLAIADFAYSTAEAAARTLTGCGDLEALCSQGAIYLLAEPVEPGAHDLAREATRIEGTYPGGYLGGGRFGPALKGGSDLDGDGFPDLAFAASSSTPGPFGWEGSAYVLFGGEYP